MSLQNPKSERQITEQATLKGPQSRKLRVSESFHKAKKIKGITAQLQRRQRSILLALRLLHVLFHPSLIFEPAHHTQPLKHAPRQLRMSLQQFYKPRHIL